MFRIDGTRPGSVVVMMVERRHFETWSTAGPVGGSGFFARAEAAHMAQASQTPPSEQPPWSRPETVFGRPVGATLVLAHTADVAVAVTKLIAYPSGFEFTAQVATRSPRRPDRLGPHFHHMFGAEPIPDEVLRLGVRFADGRSATNLDPPHALMSPPEPDSPSIRLQSGGGGGGSRRYDLNFWVWPLPPPGPVTFVCAWPAHGIAESGAELDGQLLVDAAAETRDLWP